MADVSDMRGHAEKQYHAASVSNQQHMHASVCRRDATSVFKGNMLHLVFLLTMQGCSSSAPAQPQAASRKTCPPPHYQVLGEGADADSISMFYMTVYKVSAKQLIQLVPADDPPHLLVDRC